ncbi:MAG: DUF4419 domain-containing protein [Rikenellaceae bacterium]
MKPQLNLRIFGCIVLSLIMLPITPICGAERPRKIKVEKLSKPTETLVELSREELLRKLIMDNVDTLQYIESYNPTILAHSKLPENMVNFGYNSLFMGMFEAYASHRPFAISPDVIWLLICQGFSNHVEANSEALRCEFVDFDKQKELVITTNKLPTEEDWSGFVGDFSTLVGKNTKGNIAELLECNFSTTTSAERVASQATILNSMKSYFRYTVIRAVCGIPEIQLHGTVEDWQEIIRRTKELSKYDLEWWTAEIIPLLEEIARSASGDVDKLFWRYMFKYHTKELYGSPKYVDGWIVKFYPYLRGGERSNLSEVSLGSLPDEVVRVPIKFIDEVRQMTFELELCAGFFGLEQNRKKFMLTPKIGWYLYEVESANTIEMPKHYDNLELDLNSSSSFPQSLFFIESIDLLTLRSRSIYLEQTKEVEEVNDKDTDEKVVVSYGSIVGRPQIPQRLADVKIKKIVIIGTVRADNYKQLSSQEVYDWFAEYMPDCEVEVREE